MSNGKDIKIYAMYQNAIKSFLHILDTYDNKSIKHVLLYNVKSSIITSSNK